MGTMYSKEFKIAAAKRVDETGRSVAAVAAELGINENTLFAALFPKARTSES